MDQQEIKEVLEANGITRYLFNEDGTFDLCTSIMPSKDEDIKRGIQMIQMDTRFKGGPSGVQAPTLP